MCTTCGCGEGQVHIEGEGHLHHDQHHHGTEHAHGHGDADEHGHAHGDHEHHVHEPVHAHAPGLSRSRMLQIEQDVLAKNDRFAAVNRRHFEARGILALNLLSSPGSGKTTLLTATIAALGHEVSIAVVEGDQQTALDAERIRGTGVSAVQINTGKGCHLDAHMVAHAVERLALGERSVLFIENVGNLVCPAAFDLGEAHKVVVLSVTEGEDKPLKYPDMFRAADLMLINKIDLLPYVDFDVARCVDYARRLKPAIEVIELSARQGSGMETWLDWIRRRLRPRPTIDP